MLLIISVVQLAQFPENNTKNRHRNQCKFYQSIERVEQE